MNPTSANNLLAEIDSSGRLNDIQRSIFRELVKDVDAKDAMKAVRAVYSESNSFTIPTFRQALEAQNRATFSAPMQWHLDTCKTCDGTGWEYVEPLKANGYIYDQVTRCTAGPRITRQQWAAWEAGQADRDAAWESEKAKRLT
jgi:hypothetical protein